MISSDRLFGFAATALIRLEPVGGVGGLGIAAVGAGLYISGRKS